MRPEVLARHRRLRRAVRDPEAVQASRCWCPAPTASAPSSSSPSRSNRHDTVGIDLVAMSVNDVLVQGAEPLFFLDYFACGKLDVDVADRRDQGHRRGLRAGRLRADRRRDRGDAGHVPGRRIRPRRLLRRRGREGAASSTARAIAPGDVVLGLASSGPHSNGYSLVRKIVESRRRPAAASMAHARRRAAGADAHLREAGARAARSACRSRAWRTSPAAASSRTCRACCRTGIARA